MTEPKERRKYRSPHCEDADHQYIELSKMVMWKGRRFVIVYCVKCGDTQMVGSVDEGDDVA